MITKRGDKYIRKSIYNGKFLETLIRVVHPPNIIVMVNLGWEHSSALSQEGGVFTWGLNANGRLGNGTTTSRTTPMEITTSGALNNLDPDDKIVMVNLGTEHSSALSQEGRVFTWGRGSSGGLGTNATVQRTSPSERTTAGALNNLDPDDKIVMVNLGREHSSALSQEGRVFTWGRNRNGQLGDGTTIDRLTPVEITTSGALNNLDPDDKIVMVNLNNGHSSAISEKGRVFTWGLNNLGRLGDGTTTQRTSPVEITTSGALNNLDPDDKIVMVSLGLGYSSALSEKGRVFTWGNNSNGRLGDGTTTQRTSPVEITTSGALSNLDPNDKIIMVNLGAGNSSALSQEGRVFIWGLNTNGQLGDDTTTNKESPIEITTSGALNNLDPNDKIIMVNLYNIHSSGLSKKGRVFTWGSNTNGQLGDGTTTQRNNPVEITTSGALNNL